MGIVKVGGNRKRPAALVEVVPTINDNLVSEDVSEDLSEDVLEEDVSEEDEERLRNKKRREAAQLYLATLQSSSKLKGTLSTNKDDDDVIDADETESVSDTEERLKQDILEAKGKVFRTIASQYAKEQDGDVVVKRFTSGNHSATCVSFSSDNASVFGGFKSGDIYQWDILTGSKIGTFPHQKQQLKKKGKKGGVLPTPTKNNITGHTDHVLCLAVSFDGRYLVSGGRDSLILVWDLLTKAMVTSFTAHRGAITSLVFQMGTLTLFSASDDRTVKIWNLGDLAYVDTLFGHQDKITCIDALAQERCLTVGSRDKTVRLWKVAEESQLVFRGLDDAGGSIDVATMIDNEHFATASDSGAISLWATHKKKPLGTIYECHGQGSGILALYSFRLTDLLVSSSCDGFIRLWQVDTQDYRSMKMVREVAIQGFVNGVGMSEDGRVLALAIGKDSRLGRWSVNKEAKNSITLITL